MLAYAWVTFPFTIFATNAGTNDALPAALVLGALLAHAHPLRRGALVAAAGLTKFASLALLPLFAAHDLGTARDGRTRRVLRYVAGAGLVLPPARRSCSRRPTRRRSGSGRSRSSPIATRRSRSGASTAAAGRSRSASSQAGAVLLAVRSPFMRRRDDLIGLAALAARCSSPSRLATTYWFYLYLVWVAPLALIAFLGRLASPRRRSRRRRRRKQHLLDRVGPPLAASSG